ncbi:unnamed protein product [Clonostachys solani]|uniref:Uncharacterized protein n=1 Tax=Clonostachys solani TaxID=160281 RepID=A0A9P0ENB6_9HYPO|nr:unnamed protein product [Clonostachys solani]
MAPPSITISSPADVTTPMRLLFKDIIDGVMDSTFSRTQEGPVRPLMDSQGRLPNLEKGIWLRVFKPKEGPAWNSSLPIPDPGLPSKLTPFDLRVHAGTLLVDAAPPGTDRRLFPWTVRMLDPPARGARRCGSPVFLEPRFDPQSDDKIDWFWSDRDGKAVDSRVTLVHGLNEGQTIYKFHHGAVCHRDSTTFAHALKHNIQLGAHLIRCRLKALVALGFSQELMPPFPSAGNGEDFIDPPYMEPNFFRELAADRDPDAEAQAEKNATQVMELYEYYHRR